MSYMVHDAIRSLVASFSNQSLKDKLLTVGVLMAYTGASDEELSTVAKYTIKALEAEIKISISVDMYMKGEIDKIEIPEELNEIYIALMKYLGGTLRKMREGVML